MHESGDVPADDHALWLDAETRHIEGARAFVRRSIEGLGLHPVDDVDLLTSELVSNAVQHAVTEKVGVRVQRVAPGVRVEVHDDDSALPHLRPSVPSRPGGLGMRLVDALSTDWGVEEITDDGKVVWFEIDLPGARSRP